MSSSRNVVGIVLPLNGTSEEQDGTDAETRTVVYEFWVFNITVLALAVCILMVTAAVCCVSYYSRRRQRKRTRVYESATAHDSEEELTEVELSRGRSFRNPLALLRGRDPPRDNARIYYIYSNPLPVGRRDDDEASTATPATYAPLALRDYANQPESGITLDPPTFYMQL